MPTLCQIADHRAPGRTRCGLAAVRRLALLALALTTGCAAIHPIKGVPASYLPIEFLGPSRDGLRPINPMLLTRSRPCEHLVDAGDVVTIFIPGVLGTVSTDLHSIGEYPPINFPQDPEMPPTIGFPVTVRGDGTISLPQVPPIPVRGLTLAQAEEAVRRAYTYPKQILPAGKERVLVSLQRSREYRVLVVREDTAFSTDQSGFGTINLGQSRRGTARIVSLKAYENDVLHALARGQGADGLPGLDAEGAVYVIRRRQRLGEAGPGFPGGWDGGMGVPFGAVPGDVMSGGQPPLMNGPVIRFQSPDGDYRSGGASAYGGHSFAAPRSAMPMSGRYGAAASAPQSAFTAAAPTSAPPSGGSRYGGSSYAAMPSPAAGPGFGAQVMPTNWTTISQRPQTRGNPPAMPISQPVPQTAQAWDVNPGFVQSPQPFVPGSQAGPLGPQSLPLQPQPGYPAQLPAATPQFAPAQPAMQPQGPLPGVAPLAPPVPHFPAQGMAPFANAPFTGDLPHGAYFQSMLDSGLTGTIDDPQVVRIPIRVLPGETPLIRESDVTLEDGDIVFIEARDSEVFYTGGLLGGGQYTLPRDHDLHALEAVSIAQAQGPRGGNSRSAGGVSGLNQDVTISASKLIVVRKLADGTTVPIEIDLHRAKRDMTGRENITIQPGDFLYLQYSCVEAVGAFFERHLLEGALFGVAAAQLNNNGN